jgi:hypothetical protein
MRTRLFVSLALSVGALVLGASEARASSHREAPFITKNPKVDGTDFYMFRSYEAGRDQYVTLIANYIPLQAPYGGPNFFTMDPEALYEIHIDNTGDGVEDITFQFRFSNTLANAGTGFTLPIGPADASQNVAVPLINLGPLFANDASALNVGETYTVNVVRGNRRTGTASPIAGGPFRKPVDFIGNKTFGSQAGYEAYAAAHVNTITIPGCTSNLSGRVFVGQRQEGFAVNLGPVFDLINADLATITDPAQRGAINPNPLAGYNVTSIALEVPIACLKGTSDIIAGWSTASVRQARVINPTPTYSTPAKEGGAWAQVSRLGGPLVNEAVIGIKDKDLFNSSEPKDDVKNFGTYILYPTLPKIIEVVFGAANAPAPTQSPRMDLLSAFATGVTGVNAFPTGAVPAETVKLNVAIAPTPPGAQNNLGALECFTRPLDTTTAPTIDITRDAGANGICDPAGFPNGRRPGDDIVDIALRVMMGRLLPLGVAPAGAVELHDAVLQDEAQFDPTFPYLRTPNPGS